MEIAERKETALPVIAGALDIVSGVFGVLGGIILLIISYLGEELDVGLRGITFLAALGIAILIFGAIAIYGGICAVGRVKFEWAIVGGIFALLLFFILGLPGLILVIVAKDEFK